jgi:hypothetical protein
MADDDNQEMFDRILRHLDAHPGLAGDVAFETTPTGLVAKSPAGLAHAAAVGYVRGRLEAGLGGSVMAGAGSGFATAGLKKIPDLFVIDYDRRSAEAGGYVQGVGGVLLFAEVTSPSTRAADLGLAHSAADPGKPWVYAEAGIPLYLVVDRKEARVLLYADPGPGGYPEPVIRVFGEPVWLPRPFGFALETEPLKQFV